MITFKQFLAEDSQDLIEFLKKNCMQACHDFAEASSSSQIGVQGGLWRGASMAGKSSNKLDLVFNNPDHFQPMEFVGYRNWQRKDRKPTDTPLWAHEVINEYFEDEFGGPLRGDSLFCFARYETAKMYGRPFAIFPIGHYSIYWSPRVNDLTIELFPDYMDDAHWKNIAGGKEYWREKNILKSDEVSREMQVKFIKEKLVELEFRKGPNAEAIKTKPSYEKMVQCSSYLALDCSEAEQKLIVKAVIA